MSNKASSGCIAILREVKNKWERRAPLTPSHVERLVKDGVRVIVQPSTRRVFADDEYRKAGAVLQDDVSPAEVLLGVKEVSPKKLIPDKTYMFFSHTIKAQPYNMPLLDALVAQNIRMVDYECITQTGKRNGKRTVAFGRFAGLAGMVDATRGLGERLLSMGHNSPFLSVASTFMYPDLAAAQAAMTACGEMIARYGTPAPVGPMTFVFTGKGGNVTGGALEMVRLLPHEVVTPQRLAEVAQDPHADLSKVYCCITEPKDCVAPIPGQAPVPFEQAHFFAEGRTGYEPIFHRDIAPHASLIVNGAYYAPGSPRLLSSQQLEDLMGKGGRLIGVADLSCDIKGGIGFLHRVSTIEKPFFVWDWAAGREAPEPGVDGDGVFMLAVDNLPAELPRDASQYFGDQLLPYMKPMVDALAGRGPMPVQIQGACITEAGALAPDYRYISKLRQEKEQIERMAAKKKGVGAGAGEGAGEGGVRLLLRGHLFDFSVLNRVLDLAEAKGATVALESCEMGDSRESKTTAVLSVSGAAAEQVVASVEQYLLSLSPIATCTLRRLPAEAPEPSHSPVEAAVAKSQQPLEVRDARVALVLGSGLVAGPLVSSLLLDPRNVVRLASADLAEAHRLAAGRARVQVVKAELGRPDGRNNLAELLRGVSVAVSFVPATLHTEVARACIAAGTNLVTASYCSPEMAGLDEQAKAAGMCVLNELGLDPGIDHMSALAMKRDIEGAGGKVESFISVCGGLAAPECADNPFGYRFSWNPRGVLTAGLAAARFLQDGRVVEVPGNGGLFKAAQDIVVGGPALALEMLPNRDSIPYKDIYGLRDAHTVLRGTLRYKGFSHIMSNLAALGLMDTKAIPNPSSGASSVDHLSTWGALLAHQIDASAASAEPEAVLALLRSWLAANNKGASPLQLRAVENAVRFLKLHSSAPVAKDTAVIDALCAQMREGMMLGPQDRDLILLHHRLGVRNADGTRSTHVSTLQMYGAPAASGGASAMAVTVGTPAAIGAQLLMDGEIELKGVHLPTAPHVFDPILKELEKQGIKCVEKVLD